MHGAYLIIVTILGWAIFREMFHEKNFRRKRFFVKKRVQKIHEKIVIN